MPWKHIHLLDTAVASDNIGDEIIVEACRGALGTIIRESYVTTSSSHDGLGPAGRKLAESADIIFLLGTNALSAKSVFADPPIWTTRLKRGMLGKSIRKRPPKRSFNWNISRRDAPALSGKVVLIGVGAYKVFDGVDPEQKQFLKETLSSKYTHSVRDDSALSILQACGLRAINTSCPTLWRLPQPPEELVPVNRTVCFSLTSHKPDPEYDLSLITILQDHYQKVWFWPQQPRDIDYLHRLGTFEGISIVTPNLASYDALLSRRDLDVIGTRLHGTIRGLHHGCRSLVIAIDHRATEIATSAGLEVLSRADVPEKLKRTLMKKWTSARVMEEGWNLFMDQFAP